MNSAGQSRELWSDFDGTAVGLKGKIDPRNWLKYPLPLIEGYPDFLDGVISEGVEVGGVVSRRPNIGPRRKVTELSIAKLGLEKNFDRLGSVILAGSESAKAAYIVRRAGHVAVGIIDDKPHKVGEELVLELEEFNHLGIEAGSITLGAVAHTKRGEYLDRLKSSAEKAEAGEVDSTVDGTFRIAVGRSAIKIVELLPYSVEAGQHFAQHIG